MVEPALELEPVASGSAGLRAQPAVCWFTTALHHVPQWFKVIDNVNNDDL